MRFIEEEDLLRFLTSDEVCTILPLLKGLLRPQGSPSLLSEIGCPPTSQDSECNCDSSNSSGISSGNGLGNQQSHTCGYFPAAPRGFCLPKQLQNRLRIHHFVFVMHPFDVGDRCVIDGVRSVWFSWCVQMIVEEMNILSTVFLRFDSEKIYFPNSVLLTKPISNFRRSPDMADMIDFVIDFSTPLDTINNLKKAIQTYIEGKPKYWNQKHSVIVKEIENMNKLKMCLCVTHTMNHQNFGEKNLRKTELLFELKRIFESLGIKYHLLPQEVHLTQVNMPMQA
ncbi:Mechanosensitive ion channel protein 10 [Vitis vinifera]|uniref:Mechanosensitive ion channel protein 10 n=1 Tax=Vitis vinifera TaxID=29760 RepID=A0A438FPR8_VITVI|nr:Mechanosensitive ion channel protein 10 [Vitis vinifera]